MSKAKEQEKKRLEIIEKLKAYAVKHVEKLQNRKPNTYV